jgi:hypothetical protein
VDYHTAECPRLEDRVLMAFLKGEIPPEDVPTGDGPEVTARALDNLTTTVRDLMRRLGALRRVWLTRAITHPHGYREGESVALEEAARELQQVLDVTKNG